MRKSKFVVDPIRVDPICWDEMLIKAFLHRLPASSFLMITHPDGPAHTSELVPTESALQDGSLNSRGECFTGGTGFYHQARWFLRLEKDKVYYCNAIALLQYIHTGCQSSSHCYTVDSRLQGEMVITLHSWRNVGRASVPNLYIQPALSNSQVGSLQVRGAEPGQMPLP